MTDETPEYTLEYNWNDGPHACTCSWLCAGLLWRPHCKKLSEVCASLRMISSFHSWVESEERCERYYRLRGHEPLVGLSWIHGRCIGHPHESGNFTAPIVSTDYCFDRRNQEPETLVKPTTESRSSWAEEIIIIILTVIIIASWPYKPGVPCVFTAALPFYWLRTLILIRLRECQKFRKNHPCNEIIKVIYANQLCCQLIKTGVPPLESEEVHLFS